MQLKKIQAINFGRFQQLELDIHQSLVVFYGPNEAGKSTIKELITGLLFGYEKRRSDRIASIRWGNHVAGISGELESRGRDYVINRSIQSAGVQGSISTGDVSHVIKDGPLNLTGNCSRDIYENIYALTLDEMIFPQKTWPTLQDRLLGGEMLDDIRPVSEVINELQNKIKNVWRKDRRGSSEIRQLDDQLVQARGRLDQARRTQLSLENLVLRRSMLNEKLSNLTAGMKDNELFLKEADIYNEMHEILHRIETLEQSVGDLAQYDELPLDIHTAVESNQNAVDQSRTRIAQLEEQLDQANGIVQSYDADMRNISENEEQINRIRAVALQNEQEEIHRQQCESLLVKDDHLLNVASITLLEDNTHLTQILSRINLEQLRKTFLQIRDAKRSLDIKQSMPAKENNRRNHRSSLYMLLAVCGFAIAALAGGSLYLAFIGLFSMIELTQSIVLFGGLSALGLIGGFVCLGIRRKRARQSRDELSDLERTLDQYKQAMIKELCGLQFPTDRIDALDEMILADVQKLYTLYSHCEDERKQLESITAKKKANFDIINDCVQDCLGRSYSDSAQDIQILTDLLRKAQTLKSQCDAARIQQSAIQAEIADLKADLRQRTALISRWEQIVNTAQGLTWEQKVDDILNRRETSKEVHRLRSAFHSDQRFVARMRNYQQIINDWPYEDAAIAKIHDLLDENRQEINIVHEDIGKCGNEIASLMEEQLPSDLQASVLEIEQEIRSKGRQRDRLVLAMELIMRGQEEYRIKYQPQIIQQAAKYIDIITDHRYSRLMLSEDRKNLLVFSEENGEYLNPMDARLSRGTVEQIYLALRLAIISHLDPPEDTLPILLDEVLVDWDEERLIKGIDAIADISRERQVFVFTCHKWMVDLLEHTGTPLQVIDLTQS